MAKGKGKPKGKKPLSPEMMGGMSKMPKGGMKKGKGC